MLLLVEKGLYFGGGFDTIESNIVIPAHPDDELQVCSVKSVPRVRDFTMLWRTSTSVIEKPTKSN